jgi:signal transduction histidine kinase/CheY-like chemotaxis protein
MRSKADRSLRRAGLVGLALPWLDNQATPVSAITLVLAALLMLTAVLAFVLVWLLQSQIRKNRRLHDQLLAQQSLHQQTLDALPFPISLHGLDGLPVAGNQRSHDMPGSTEAAVRALQDASFAAHKDAILQGHASRQEVSYLADRNAIHSAHLWVHAVFDGERRARGYAASVLDITEFREAEREAKQTEKHLDEVARRIPVVVLALRLDANGMRHLTFATGNTKALFNIMLSDLRDTDGHLQIDTLRDRIHPDDLLAFEQLMAPAAREAPVRTLDFRAFGEQGPRWIHATLAPLRDVDGGSRLVGYFIDTTEQNLRNEALRIARDVAERASKAKADFLATMSHEIRTPMNGVIGMLELLGRTPINQEQRELLRAVDDSAATLLQILNDILDFSKLEAGDLRLDIAPFDPRLWLDDAASLMAASARKKGIELRMAIDAGVAGQLRGDSLRLRQILLNLLNNAIKFTDRGSVTARLVVLGDSGSHQHVCLTIADTGIGIEEDKQALLFKPFAQAEAWTSRRYGGTGLGLAICNHLVQLMDGTIELISEVGTGTTIRVELHLPLAERTTDAPDALRGRHAVVRLAPTETASALAEYLRAAGMTVEHVDPGRPLREGMAASLLFIDRYDAASETQISAHVVAVTDEPLAPASVQWTGERVLLSTNPLKWQSVLRASMGALELEDPSRWLDAAPEAAEALPTVMPTPLPQAPAELPAPRGHILVAEDHPVSQQLIARQLALLGFNCDIVDNGRDAYEALSGERYALLLTDCNMPLMSGYELAKAWRQHEEAQGAGDRLPILAMTANALSSETARARDAGMDDVLSKPLQLSALSRKLDQWLPETAPLLPDDRATQTSAELQHLFTEVSQHDLQHLRGHIARKDLSATTLVLHRLLGVLPLFADANLVEDGQRLFDALHTADAPKQFPELNAFADRLEGLIAALRRP